jgi:hypothetical protein
MKIKHKIVNNTRTNIDVLKDATSLLEEEKDNSPKGTIVIFFYEDDDEEIDTKFYSNTVASKAIAVLAIIKMRMMYALGLTVYSQDLEDNI